MAETNTAVSDVKDVAPITDELEYLQRGQNDGKKESDTDTEDSKDSDDEADSGKDSGKEDEDESTEDSEVEEDDNPDDDTDDDEDEEIDVTEDTLYNQIKSVAPKLFKEVPELKRVIFREQEYSKYFPSVEDAKIAAQTADVFSEFERDLNAGKSENLIKALESTNKKSLENFVVNLPETLKKHNKDLYLEGFVYPTLKMVLRAAARHSDPRMKASAENLNIFMFGDSDLAKDEGLKPNRDSRDEEFEKREKEFNEKKAIEFENDLHSSADKRMKFVIGKQFTDSGFSKLLQETMTNEIAKRVDIALSKDIRHMGNMKGLLKQAERAGFTTEWKDRIKNTYLSRANVLIPKIRQQVLSEAKLTSKPKEETKEKKRIPSSNMSADSKGKVNFKNIDWTKTSEEDVINGKITYKK